MSTTKLMHYKIKLQSLHISLLPDSKVEQSSSLSSPVFILAKNLMAMSSTSDMTEAGPLVELKSTSTHSSFHVDGSNMLLAMDKILYNTIHAMSWLAPLVSHSTLVFEHPYIHLYDHTSVYLYLALALLLNYRF